jgi:hypothetical protein
MDIVYTQYNFSGGLNRTFDSTKLQRNQYPLLINGRVRKNIITPTQKHVQIPVPGGNIQGIYAFGNVLVVFISGGAFYADMTQPGMPVLNPVLGWQPFSANAPKVYACPVPTTFSFFTFNQSSLQQIFPGTIGAFPAGLICQDGVSQPQIIFPGGSSQVLGTYDSWTMEVPNYVPIGTLMAFSGSKLYIVAPNGNTIYQSVSGRPTDFMVNLTTDGSKGGDASTVSVAVGLEPITAIVAAPQGNLFVGTAYACHTLTLNPGNTNIFGEPQLVPAVAFPTGIVNERSYSDILGDTTFISPSGIHSFNWGLYFQRQTNNGPLGAPVRDLMVTPLTNTAQINFDDYVLSAVSTIYGDAVIVLDSLLQPTGTVSFTAQNSAFVSVDRDFGSVRQFTATRVNGTQRMFFYTAANQLFEAYASSATQRCEAYIGDFTLPVFETVVSGVLVDFVNVQTSGYLEVDIYCDKQLVGSTTRVVNSTYNRITADSELPYNPNSSPISLLIPLPKNVRCDQVGVFLQWTFNGSLSKVSFVGNQADLANPMGLQQVQEAPTENFLYLGNPQFGSELAGGTQVSIATIPGNWYAFVPTSAADFMMNGQTRITQQGFYQAEGAYVFVTSGSLKDASLVMAVLLAANSLNIPFTAAILGGDTPYVLQSAKSLPSSIVTTLGDRDFTLWPAFGQKFGIPTYYSVNSQFVTFAVMNGGWTAANAVPVDASGAAGSVTESDGNVAGSYQANFISNKLATATTLYKVLLVHEPPFTNDTQFAPGYAALRQNWLCDMVLSGHAYTYERYDVNSTPYVNLGVSGSNNSTTLVSVGGMASNGASANASEAQITGISGFGILTANAVGLSWTAYSLDASGTPQPIDTIDLPSK